jgi:hypothetical protein
MLDQELLLSDFPTNIKLSYENLAHKKVCKADLIMAVPRGQKCFVWFTEYEDQNACFLLEIGQQGTQIQKIQQIRVQFDPELVYNTILQGTLFYEEKTRLFSIEDIFYYKGRDMTKCDWLNKLDTMATLLKSDLLQKEQQFMQFGLPLFSSKWEELLIKIKQVKYRIEKVQYYLFGKVGSFLYMPYSQNTKPGQTIPPNQIQNQKPQYIEKPQYNQKPQYIEKPINRQNLLKKEVVFNIKPDIQNDIYYLHSSTDDTLVDTACIPDYKTSVLMNRLFRNIKENENLDKLEESDDEEEFENESPERFVHLDRNYKMVCTFHHKFRKWVPIRLVNA